MAKRKIGKSVLRPVPSKDYIKIQKLVRGKAIVIETPKEVKSAGGVEIYIRPIPDKTVRKTKITPYTVDSIHGQRLLLVHRLKKKGKSESVITNRLMRKFNISKSTASWYLTLYRLRDRPAKRKWLTNELFKKLLER